MKVQIKILNKEFYREGDSHENRFNDQHDLPSYATPGSAGLDLRCTKDVTIYPGQTVRIPTGLAIWVGATRDEWLGNEDNDFGIMGIIVPRSGLGTKGLVLANTIGVIDEDYQGELLIAAWNRNTPKEETLGDDGVYRDHHNPIYLKAGDRIAQLVFMPFIKCQWDIVEEFSNNTERGHGGYGSTGE